MINGEIKRLLEDNWGEKAESMNCYTEVKFIDTESAWACYIYALNPADENTIACIIDGICLEVCEWTLKELYFTYNNQGEHPVLDQEFRRMRTSELFKKLSEGR